LPEAKRSKPTPGGSPQPDDDPRLALARQYLNKAAADLEEQEAAKPRRERRANRSGGGSISISFAAETFVHLVLATLALTFAAFCVLLCFHLLTIN
jgi:hypothetical protein